MAILDEPQKSASTLVADLTKQLITLASAFLTVTITFSKDLLAIVDKPGLLQVAWVGFIVSVIAGILAMMALAGRVQALTATAPTLMFNGSLRVFSIIQVITFALALAVISIAGITTIGEALPPR